METVAFYGPGMLGSAMIRAMLDARPSGARLEPFATQGRGARGPRRASVRRCRRSGVAARTACILCLSDDASVDAVIDAALPGIAATSPIVDHTTVTPQGVVERVRRLGEAGYSFLHAPVFMGPPMALHIDRRDDGLGRSRRWSSASAARSKPCAATFATLGRASRRPRQSYNLMGNAMIFAVVAGINDVLRIGEEQGLSREQIYALFDFYDPSGQIKGRGKRMAGEDYAPVWSVDMAHKDAVLMQTAAHHERLPLIDAVEGLLRNVSDRGLGGLDLAAVAQR